MDGWKLLRRDPKTGTLTSWVGGQTYVVGERVRLPRHAPLVICSSGYHFCPQPLECLEFVSLKGLAPSEFALAKVRAELPVAKGPVFEPAKYATAELTVVEVLSDEAAASLLTGKVVSNLKTCWYVSGKLHGVDGLPAVIWHNGDMEWRDADGQLHRPYDHPAVVSRHGRKEWWVNGVRHRDGGPAVIHPNDTLEWWRMGVRHRDDGPAVTGCNGYQQWWVDGVRHRDDGPAVTGCTGYQEWWVDGVRHRDDGPAVIDCAGYQEWWRRGLPHRDEGPAVLHSDGSKQWLLQGAEVLAK
jgi:hypothetical protein